MKIREIKVNVMYDANVGMPDINQMQQEIRYLMEQTWNNKAPGYIGMTVKIEDKDCEDVK